MLKSVIKSALRHFLKKKGFSLINILGLSLGLAACLLVLQYVNDEIGYDQYHDEKDRLYRLSLKVDVFSSEVEYLGASSSYLWGPALTKDYSGIDEYARVIPVNYITGPFADTWLASRNDDWVAEDKLYFSDASIFDVFTWPMLEGDASTALARPNSIVLSTSMAEKYFQGQSPIGKMITFDTNSSNPDKAETNVSFQVTGVMHDIPDKSHLKPDFLISLSTLNSYFGGDMVNGFTPRPWYWRGTVGYTYLLLNPNTSPELFSQNFEPFIDKYLGDMTTSRGYDYVPMLQKVEDIHFDSQYNGNPEPGGDRTQLTILGVVALFILLISMVNYINLATARAAERGRELGVRGVMGASQGILLRQMIVESIIFCLLAAIAGLLLFLIFTPTFYSLLGKAISITEIDWVLIIPGLFVISIITGLVAGSYPAFFILRFPPYRLVKGIKLSQKSGRKLRQSLVVLQFGISIFFLIATFVVGNQITYMQSFGLGFDPQGVLVIPPEKINYLGNNQEAFKNEVRRIQGVIGASSAIGVPGNDGVGDIFADYNDLSKEGTSMTQYMVDFEYLRTIGLNVVQGRALDINRSTDHYPAQVSEGAKPRFNALINETAAQALGWSAEEAIGKQLTRDPNDQDFVATVVGVIKDFHLQSLQQPINPLILYNRPEARPSRQLAIRVRPDARQELITSIESVWLTMANDEPFDYYWMDQSFLEQYAQEENRSQVYRYASVIALIISALGLLGLATYAAQSRLKEISIRKVLGARTLTIASLLSTEFFILIAVAILLASPAAWYFMDKWLDNYPYRIAIGLSEILPASLFALLVCAITISFQTLKASRQNPIRGLRDE